MLGPFRLTLLNPARAELFDGAVVDRAVPLAPRRRVIGRRIDVRPGAGMLAVGALIGANLIWGGSVAATAAVLDHIPPLTLACCRAGIGLAILCALLALTGARPETGRWPALLGLTGVALFCAGQNLGLRYASAGTTSLINGAIPALTVLLAIILLHERMGGRRRLAGLVTSLIGIALLVWRGSGGSHGAAAWGNLLPLLSAASFALFAVFGRRVFDGGNMVAVVAGSTRYGLLFLLPGAVVEVMSGRQDITVDSHDLLWLLFLGAGCSALAFVLAAYGLAHLEAGYGAAFGNLKPLVGIALAVALLGEQVTGGQMLGGALALLGVVVAGRAMPEERAENTVGGEDGRIAL